MKHAIVSRCTEGAFRYQAWPTVTRAEDGTLFVGCSGHRRTHICPFGTNLMYVSRDEGETWSAPQIVNDTYVDNRDAGMLAWGDGKLLLTWINHTPEWFYRIAATDLSGKPHYDLTSPLAAGMLELWKTIPREQLYAGSYTRLSRDNGKSWSGQRLAPVTSPHGPCLAPDGSLLFLGSLRPNGNEYGGEPGKIRLYRSADEGESWELVSIPPLPEGADEKLCFEPHLIVLKDGTLLGAVRYHFDKGHGNRKMYVLRSTDGGKSWETPYFPDVIGCPPHFLQHSSGAVVMTFSKRVDVMGEYAIVSHDGGRTWSKETLISPVAPDWDHGYPSTVELANGDLFTVYYMKCPGDDYNSIHSVRWNLSELE